MHDFVMDALLSMLPAYGPEVVQQQVILWYDRAGMTEEDVLRIDGTIREYLQRTTVS